jgi:ribose/xylose/arabinose/galactoside ABC-type transport system permease subunit
VAAERSSETAVPTERPDPAQSSGPTRKLEPPKRPAYAEWLGHEGLLLLVVIAEIVYFGIRGTNFLTVGNAFEVARASVEIGLLALALTAVILTGGIDLSVGSLLGLSAILLGWALRDARLPVAAAALVAIATGLAGGGLNALLVARLRIPPLIVTLGTFSLFRGIAEGFTGGVRNYTDFPQGLLFLGQGRLPGGMPAQLPLLVAAAVLFWLLLHRTGIGRGLRAIGFSPDGARHAGIPVERRLALAYVMSGVVAGLAALVYAARLGQAKADAGTGYELYAITAVVLGGTSIFGGRGTVHGTLLGVAAVALLQNGLRLADLPAELAGILTGALLVAAIGSNRLLAKT